ncbi:unnamed protein product [Amoebophrya sp. A120]|nr:unnamed protein product [Amoebophrya sp. A120]|eukprot:GSA120T00002617001.1
MSSKPEERDGDAGEESEEEVFAMPPGWDAAPGTRETAEDDSDQTEEEDEEAEIGADINENLTAGVVVGGSSGSSAPGPGLKEEQPSTAKAVDKSEAANEIEKKEVVEAATEMKREVAEPTSRVEGEVDQKSAASTTSASGAKVALENRTSAAQAMERTTGRGDAAVAASGSATAAVAGGGPKAPVGQSEEKVGSPKNKAGSPGLVLLPNSDNKALVPDGAEGDSGNNPLERATGRGQQGTADQQPKINAVEPNKASPVLTNGGQQEQVPKPAAPEQLSSSTTKADTHMDAAPPTAAPSGTGGAATEGTKGTFRPTVGSTARLNEKEPQLGAASSGALPTTSAQQPAVSTVASPSAGEVAQKNAESAAVNTTSSGSLIPLAEASGLQAGQANANSVGESTTMAFSPEAFEEDEDDDDDEDEDEITPRAVFDDDTGELHSSVAQLTQFPRRCLADLTWPPPQLKCAKVLRPNPFDDSRAGEMTAQGHWRVVIDEQDHLKNKPNTAAADGQQYATNFVAFYLHRRLFGEDVKEIPGAADGVATTSGTTSTSTAGTATASKGSENNKTGSATTSSSATASSSGTTAGTTTASSSSSAGAPDEASLTISAKLQEQYPVIHFLKRGSQTLQEKLKLLMSLLHDNNKNRRREPKELIEALWYTLSPEEQQHVHKNLPDLAKYAKVAKRPRPAAEAGTADQQLHPAKLQRVSPGGRSGVGGGGANKAAPGSIAASSSAIRPGTTSTSTATAGGLQQVGPSRTAGVLGAPPPPAATAKAAALSTNKTEQQIVDDANFVVTDDGVTTLRVMNLPVGVKAQELGQVFQSYSVLGVNVKKSKKNDRYVGFVRVANRPQAKLAIEAMEAKKLKFGDILLNIAIDEAQTRVAQQAVEAQRKQAESAASGLSNVSKEEIQKKVWVPRVTFSNRVLGIQMSRLKLTDQGLAEWCQWVPKVLTELEKHNRGKLANAVLDFSHNQLTDAGVGQLVEMLKKQRVHVADLSLGHNLLTDQSMRSLGELVTSQTDPMHKLGLESNTFTAKGILYLSRKLKNNTNSSYPRFDQTTLKYVSFQLSVRGNENLDANELLALLAQNDIAQCQKLQEGRGSTSLNCPMLYLPGLTSVEVLGSEMPTRSKAAGPALMHPNVDEDVSRALGPEMMATVFGKAPPAKASAHPAGWQMDPWRKGGGGAHPSAGFGHGHHAYHGGYGGAHPQGAYGLHHPGAYKGAGGHPAAYKGAGKRTVRASDFKPNGKGGRLY